MSICLMSKTAMTDTLRNTATVEHSFMNLTTITARNRSSIGALIGATAALLTYVSHSHTYLNYK